MNNITNEYNDFKAGYVAIVGRPNVGKSTLMNSFLQQKLAIVSPRPQTTRNKILGILHGKKHQIIFQDTPGLIEPKYLLQTSMKKSVMTSLDQADIIMVLIEAKGLKDNDHDVLTLTKSINKKKILVINKIDMIKKEQVLPLIDEMTKYDNYEAIVPVSALESTNLDELEKIIIEHLPMGMPFYPPDMISDEPERFFVSEIIREQIFLKFGQEIPYSTAVRIDDFKERPGRKDYIRSVIIVERESQKPILIGKGGKALKAIGASSRLAIEKFLDRPVFLELHVVVQRKWRKNAVAIKRLGY
ncbi:GTPase Era [bacterium]|nr:GTPase Era [bacterium]